MVMYTKEIGKMAFKKEKVKKNSLTVPLIKATSKIIKDMAKGQ